MQARLVLAWRVLRPARPDGPDGPDGRVELCLDGALALRACTALGVRWAWGGGPVVVVAGDPAAGCEAGRHELRPRASERARALAALERAEWAAPLRAAALPAG